MIAKRPGQSGRRLRRMWKPALLLLLVLPLVASNADPLLRRGAYIAMMPTDPPAGWLPLRILTANIGNLSLGCLDHYNNKLCYTVVETAIAASISRLRPDVVFLQEVLHPSQCEGWIEDDPDKVCYKFGEQVEKYQPRRLLGPEYTIACFARAYPALGHPLGLECIAVRVDAGSIEECSPGELCLDAGRLDRLEDGCDPGFAVASVVAHLRGLRVALVNVHANSRDYRCRVAAIRQIFERQGDIPALASEPYSLIAGDFNLDPFAGGPDLIEFLDRTLHGSDDDLIQLWDQYVGAYGSGRSYYYHSGPAEYQPPYPTAYSVFGRKIVDHVLSNFALGTCITLGEAPGTERIDGGWGMDHRAIVGDLWIPPPGVEPAR